MIVIGVQHNSGSNKCFNGITMTASPLPMGCRCNREHDRPETCPTRMESAKSRDLLPVTPRTALIPIIRLSVFDSYSLNSILTYILIIIHKKVI